MGFGIDQRRLLVDVGRLRLFDNQSAVKACTRRKRRVIPKGPRIRSDEAIVEACARRDGCLRQRRCAVHRIGEPHAVPMYGRRLLKFVHDADGKLFAALHPQFRSWHLAVKARLRHPEDADVGGLRRSDPNTGGSERRAGRERAGHEAAARKRQ